MLNFMQHAIISVSNDATTKGLIISGYIMVMTIYLYKCKAIFVWKAGIFLPILLYEQFILLAEFNLCPNTHLSVFSSVRIRHFEAISV